MTGFAGGELPVVRSLAERQKTERFRCCGHFATIGSFRQIADIPERLRTTPVDRLSAAVLGGADGGALAGVSDAVVGYMNFDDIAICNLAPLEATDQSLSNTAQLPCECQFELHLCPFSKQTWRISEIGMIDAQGLAGLH